MDPDPRFLRIKDLASTRLGSLGWTRLPRPLCSQYDSTPLVPPRPSLAPRPLPLQTRLVTPRLSLATEAFAGPTDPSTQRSVLRRGPPVLGSPVHRLRDPSPKHWLSGTWVGLRGVEKEVESVKDPESERRREHRKPSVTHLVLTQSSGLTGGDVTQGSSRLCPGRGGPESG